MITPSNAGYTVQLDNTGTIPKITTNANLNDPNAFGWQGGRVNMQDERRETDTKGARFALHWAHWDAANLHFGGAYDDVSRRINAFDNTQAWQNAACGGNPSIFLPAPNGQPPCEGRASATPGLVTPAGHVSGLSRARHECHRRHAEHLHVLGLADSFVTARLVPERRGRMASSPPTGSGSRR